MVEGDIQFSMEILGIMLIPGPFMERVENDAISTRYLLRTVIILSNTTGGS